MEESLKGVFSNEQTENKLYRVINRYKWCTTLKVPEGSVQLSHEKSMRQLECIPVGCVPHACHHKGGGLCLGGVSVWEGLWPRGILSRRVSVQGSLCPGGLCAGGSLSSVVSVQGGLCPGESLSSVVSVQGSLCPGGLRPGRSLSIVVSVQGAASRGVSVQCGLCPGEFLSRGTVKTGW